MLNLNDLDTAQMYVLFSCVVAVFGPLILLAAKFLNKLKGKNAIRIQIRNRTDGTPRNSGAD